MEEKIINILKSSKDYVSGEYLSEKLNVSRTSIWKHNDGSETHTSVGDSNKNEECI